MAATKEELDTMKPMPFMAMVASVGSNDKSEMYNYLGGVKTINAPKSWMPHLSRKNPTSVSLL